MFRSGRKNIVKYWFIVNKNIIWFLLTLGLFWWLWVHLPTSWWSYPLFTLVRRAPWTWFPLDLPPTSSAWWFPHCIHWWIITSCWVGIFPSRQHFLHRFWVVLAWVGSFILYRGECTFSCLQLLFEFDVFILKGDMGGEIAWVVGPGGGCKGEVFMMDHILTIICYKYGFNYVYGKYIMIRRMCCQIGRYNFFFKKKK